jgi:hypothetical protein
MQTSPVVAAHYVLAVAGFSLAAAGAFANWITFSMAMPGVTASGASGFFSFTYTASVPSLGISQTTNTSANPTGNLGAAAAMLILGFILGFFHFVALLLKANKVTFASSTVIIALSALAVVTTFIGTVIGGQVRSPHPTTAHTNRTFTDSHFLLFPPPPCFSSQFLAASVAQTGFSWGAAFGCSIAATVVQFIALVLEVLASLGAAAPPVLKSEAPTAAGAV